MPKVSVIIPVYNAAPYIADTLRSVQRQTMSDFEVLLVDDHGQDDSMSVAKATIGKDARFRSLETPVNSGPGVARNVGIMAAQGEYIAFLDSDDLWEPTFLEKQLGVRSSQPLERAFLCFWREDEALAEGSKSCSLIYCQLKYRGGSKDGQVHRNPVMQSGVITPAARKHFLLHFVTFSVCFLYRREFLLSNGLFFPAKRNSEDTNFLTRCLLLADTIACVDEPLYIYNVREESLTTGRNPQRYKERLQSLNALMRDFKALKRDARYKEHRLGQYNLVMALIWLKKGLAQAIKELI